LGVEDQSTPPGPVEIEVNVFGPGFGESILVHIGQDRWVIVDSCRDSATRRPAPLLYLDRIGVDASNSVIRVIASHWHDDHVRGLTEIVRTCQKAQFCSSAALTREEFLEIVETYATANQGAAKSGTSEMHDIMRLLQARAGGGGPNPKSLLEDSLIFRGSGNDLVPCEIRTLSPSSAEFAVFLQEMTGLMPSVLQPKRRLSPVYPNNASVVTYFEFDGFSVLLGADLEEHGHHDRGWSAILASQTRPTVLSSLFKVPHHGSSNGHSQPVWDDLLATPISVITPWTRGSGLPQVGDISRVRGKSSGLFITSSILAPSARKRTPIVERQIREMGIRLRTTEPRTGHVRLRRSAGSSLWKHALFDGAFQVP
jgi:hypothetical protein